MRDTNLINSEFKNKNLNVMWNKLKLHKKSKVNSTLKTFDFENHFNLLTKDEIPLNPDQLKIKAEVHERSLLISRKYPPWCPEGLDPPLQNFLTPRAQPPPTK